MYRAFGKRVIDFTAAMFFILLFWWLLAIVALLVRLKLGLPVFLGRNAQGEREISSICTSSAL